MDYASRRAQHIANQFMDDMDSMSTASRMRDRRALSHFEAPLQTQVVREPSVVRTVRYSSRLGSVPPIQSETVYSSNVTSNLTSSAVPTYQPSVLMYPRVVRSYRYPRHASVGHALNRVFETTTTTDAALPPVYSQTYNTPRVYKPLSSGVPMATTTMTRVAPRYPGLAGSASTSSLAAERRRLNRRLDDVMDFKFPSSEYYGTLRRSLLSLNDKMNSHRQMLDRYSGIDLTRGDDSVTDRIDRKFAELKARG